jgi:NAD(P)-dependent dehydrogenase (short-subunit alcohol dehydrogenase family)
MVIMPVQGKGTDRMRDFDGKVAVVTGGASGMGRAFAERFAQAGMNVVLADIEEEALETAVRELEQQEHRVIGVVTNTMQKASVEALADQAIDAFGAIHVVCNNAGVASPGDTQLGTRGIWEVSDSDWQWVMGVNFWGVLYGVQVFVPRMLAQGSEGHVINTASIAGLSPGASAYGVSKHAVVALSESLASGLRERAAPIGVSVLCPGMVQTRIMEADRNRPEDLPDAASLSAENQALIDAMLAQGKLPVDIAEMVFQAVEHDQFYILPHPVWDDSVRDRMEHILARGPAAELSMDAIAERVAAGEQV